MFHQRRGHHSYHMQVSSILQQCMVDDLLLVATGTQHHGAHHKIVFEEKLFEINVKKIPSGLCPEEVALLVRLNREYPSPCYMVSRLELPHVNEIKNLIVKEVFVLMVLRLSKLFVLSSYFLS